MSRYFLELRYKGTAYSGFQRQHNAVTVQAVVEDALRVLVRKPVELTGSSRTDAGVHALQNYFHFDWDDVWPAAWVYKLNAILPPDIAVISVRPVPAEAHCRFDARWREYNYFIYSEKNPFWADRAYYYPYPVDEEALQAAAAVLFEYEDFTSFSKRNTQVKNFRCKILESRWERRGETLVYVVRANRFLRGMVRALTATMLLVGRGKMTVEEWRSVIESRDCTRARFAVPGHGLTLVGVDYPPEWGLRG